MQVQYRDDLGRTNGWKNIGAPVSWNGSVSTFVDSDVSTNTTSRRFYRAVLVNEN